MLFKKGMPGSEMVSSDLKTGNAPDEPITTAVNENPHLTLCEVGVSPRLPCQYISATQFP